MASYVFPAYLTAERIETARPCDHRPAESFTGKCLEARHDCTYQLSESQRAQNPEAMNRHGPAVMTHFLNSVSHANTPTGCCAKKLARYGLDNIAHCVNRIPHGLRALSLATNDLVLRVVLELTVESGAWQATII